MSAVLLCALSAGAGRSAWIDVPFVQQIRGGCGSAAIAMVMQYWVKHQPGLDATAAAAEQIVEALPPASSGISGNELQQYLQNHGFSAFVFDGEYRDLENHLAKGRPLVVCLGLKGPNAPLHFAVVVGSGDQEVILNDPARGKLLPEPKDKFLRAWGVTENWTLLAVPSPAS